MFKQRPLLQALLLTGSLALAAASAHAQPPAEPGCMPPPPMLGEAMGMPPMGLPAMGEMMLAGLPPPPYLHALKLNETQQDQVFTLLNKMAPQLRERAKAAHKARKELHKLALAETVDEARVKTLASASADAEAEIGMIHAYIDHQIFVLLTSEQRQQLLAMKPPRDARPRMPRMAPPPFEPGPAMDDNRQ